MNNLDIIILILVGISALIGLSRGLVKEVLSIVGWVLAVVAIVYLLPVLNPLMSKYIENGVVAGIASASLILIAFMVSWILLTGALIDRIHDSKLKGLDRTLGLFFGIFRAFLLIVLANIAINWVYPKEEQSKVFTESKYYKIAGNFAEPIEKLIPKETLDAIKQKASAMTESEKEKKEKEETDDLFNKLAQPKVKAKEGADEKDKEAIKENVDTKGYDKKERDNLNKLIENHL